MSERYRVPKFKVPVELHTRQGGREVVHLFLSEHAEEHVGAERPLDLLNGDGEFFVVEQRDGEAALVRRGNVALVAELREDAPDPVDASGPGLCVEAKVKLILEDGREIEGETLYELPEESRRVQDFFNSSARFVPLRRKGRVYFVNKHCIARVLLR